MHPANLLTPRARPRRPEFSLHCLCEKGFCPIKVSLGRVRKLSEERGKAINSDRAYRASHGEGAVQISKPVSPTTCASRTHASRFEHFCKTNLRIIRLPNPIERVSVPPIGVEPGQRSHAFFISAIAASWSDLREYAHPRNSCAIPDFGSSARVF
jgi:hypothetical protein